jgi:AcrR family transcriptional regulator
VARRDEILTVAKAQIAQRGYTAASMRDIAEAAGLLAGSLYSHFRSKAELVRDIVTRFYDELIPAQRAIVESAAPGAEKFRAMVGVVYEVCSRHRDELTILHYDWQVLSSLPELSDVRDQSLETLDLWQVVVDQGKADGSIVPSVDTAVVVRVVTSAIHALNDSIRYSDRPIGERDGELPAMLQALLIDGIATASSGARAGSATADGGAGRHDG